MYKNKLHKYAVTRSRPRLSHGKAHQDIKIAQGTFDFCCTCNGQERRDDQLLLLTLTTIVLCCDFQSSSCGCSGLWMLESDVVATAFEAATDSVAMFCCWRDSISFWREIGVPSNLPPSAVAKLVAEKFSTGVSARALSASSDARLCVS